MNRASVALATAGHSGTRGGHCDGLGDRRRATTANLEWGGGRKKSKGKKHVEESGVDASEHVDSGEYVYLELDTAGRVLRIQTVKHRAFILSQTYFPSTYVFTWSHHPL